jgi:hypothetical protein
LSLAAESRLLARTQLASYDLPGHRQWEVVQEFDFARRLVSSEPDLYVYLNFLDNLLRGGESRKKFDERLDR